jgi:hypothetical protein
MLNNEISVSASWEGANCSYFELGLFVRTEVAFAGFDLGAIVVVDGLVDVYVAS